MVGAMNFCALRRVMSEITGDILDLERSKQ
jgi:hypothetical protein